MISANQLQQRSLSLLSLLKLTTLSHAVQTWVRKQIVDDDPWDETELATNLEKPQLEAMKSVVTTNTSCDRSNHLNNSNS
jgi:hypothetical protein